MNNEKKYSIESRLIQGKSVTGKWDYNHHVVPPISSSTTFRLDSTERGALGFSSFGSPEIDGNEMIYVYDRLGEPNKEILEETLAYAEDGEAAVTFTSGMGAISGVLGILTKSDDEIIYHKTLYGCTYSLLNNWYPRYNIRAIKVDLTDLEQLKHSITSKTKVIYFESLANPTLDIIDLPKLSEIVKEVNSSRLSENKILIVVDNTFATPYCHRPLKFGADIVIHSLTKNIGGFGTDMGGVAIIPKRYKDSLMLFRKDIGAVLNTKSAWAILVYGISSLPLRVQREIKSASFIAKELEKHSLVSYVNYPGLKSFKFHELAKLQLIDYDGNFAPGNMIWFGIKGSSPEDSKEKGKKLMNYIAKNAYTITLAVSLGHIKTLCEHPGSMTHSVIPADEQIKAGLDPAGIRLSIGLENPNDILKDLYEAFDIIK